MAMEKRFILVLVILPVQANFTNQFTEINWRIIMFKFTVQLSNLQIVSMVAPSFAVVCATVVEESDGDVRVIRLIEELSL
jgi:hypothetical protein